jgi:hypothetical protein
VVRPPAAPQNAGLDREEGATDRGAATLGSVAGDEVDEFLDAAQ